jgi:hypothetical protein
MIFVPHKLNLDYMTDNEKIALGHRVNNHHFWRTLLREHLSHLPADRLAEIAQNVYDRKIQESIDVEGKGDEGTRAKYTERWDTHHGQLWQEVGDLIAERQLPFEEVIRIGASVGVYYLWTNMLKPYAADINAGDKDALRLIIADSFRKRTGRTQDLDEFNSWGVDRIFRAAEVADHK